MYTCKHTTYALGKYCEQGNLVQTPCKQKKIWQTIRMDELCEACAAREAAGDHSRVVEKESRVVNENGGGKAVGKKSSS